MVYAEIRLAGTADAPICSPGCPKILVIGTDGLSAVYVGILIPVPCPQPEYFGARSPVVLTIVLITTWAATQWTAWRLGYQPQLGHPWFELAPGIPIYLPPAFFWWWYAYDAYAPGVFVEGACVAASGGIISIIAAFAMSVWRAREAETAATYGSARWANQLDIRRAGLAGADGVILGRFEGQYLRHDGPEHVLCFAPTRSGKGVGLVVPTLLTWPGSCHRP